jgi:hypothetical protein
MLVNDLVPQGSSNLNLLNILFVYSILDTMSPRSKVISKHIVGGQVKRGPSNIGSSNASLAIEGSLLQEPTIQHDQGQPISQGP